MRMRIIVFGTVLLALGACMQPARVPATRDADAIAALHTARRDAFEAGDVDRWLAMVAPDAVFMPMDAPTASNRDELRRFYTNWFSSTRIELQISRDEMVVKDDLAYVRGRVTITETPRQGGTSRTDRRRFVEIFKKAATGEWQFWRVIWNSETRRP